MVQSLTLRTSMTDLRELMDAVHLTEQQLECARTSVQAFVGGEVDASHPLLTSFLVALATNHKAVVMERLLFDISDGMKRK